MRFRMLFLFFIPLLVSAQNKFPNDESKWETFAEKSNYKKTPDYFETITYCKRLESASKLVKIIYFGKSLEDKDLYCLVLSKDGSFTPEKNAQSNKPLIMIQCGIHAGEIDGKDAMLAMMRDIVINNKLNYLLDNTNLLIIPIFNIDGHERISPYNRINQNGPEEMGWRVTANNLNLNRDYLKADAIEMRYWLKLFNDWLPDFFIDCHVTDGVDFPYTVTYEVETHENISSGLAEWTKHYLMPYVYDNIKKNNHLLAPYAYFVNDFDISKGIVTGVMSPKLSTGYTAIQNRQGFLIETHSYKDYKTRVDATYQLVKIIIEYINKNHKILKNLNRTADKESENIFYSADQFPLSFNMVNVPNGKFDFKSYKVLKEFSDISKSYKKVYTQEILENTIPVYDSFKVSKSIRPPFAYIIPIGWKNIVSILQLHGIKAGKFLDDVSLKVERYKLTSPKWRDKPYEGRNTLTYNVEKYTETVNYPKGTLFVPMNQRTSKVIMHLLEPESKESLVSWGFMNTIFEQKEYGEDYVLEKLAEKMLKEDNSLKTEFENKINSDSVFANNPYERLNFFYKKSPYYDQSIGLYPVARLMEKRKF